MTYFTVSELKHWIKYDLVILKMQYKVKKNYFTENTNRNLMPFFICSSSTTKLKRGLDIKLAKGFISYFLFLIEPLL